MLFTDWNRSGTPSLRVSNDREYYKGGQEQMWHLEPGQPPRLLHRGRGLEAAAHLGHGHRQRRCDRDGYPDYFLTSMADNKLQVLKDRRRSAKPDYADVAFPNAGSPRTGPIPGDDLQPFDRLARRSLPM